ncbi:hypothetical protein Pelo_8278 [Pelomyxa schiedti]|nr:hypothetical protein Pelo_8278 [Pelomyxa schiedti]
MTTVLPTDPQRQAMCDACTRGDMPRLPSPTWDINTPIDGRGGWTMLHLACWYGHESLARQLLCVGASRSPPIDPNATDNSHCRTPLYYAAREGKEPVVRVLVARPDVDVNKGCPLAVACREREAGVVVALLECPRVDVNLAMATEYQGIIGQTALHVACEQGFVEGVKVLLQVNGIDTNRKNNKGETPLDVATRRNCTDICNLFKNHNTRVQSSELEMREKEREIARITERAETMTSLVGANIDSFAMMKFLGSGSNAATFQVKFFPRGGCSSVPQLQLQPSSTSTTKPLDNNTPTMAMKVLFNWESTPHQTLIKQKYMKECVVLASVPLHPNVIHPLGTLVIPRFPTEFIAAIPSAQPVYREFALNKSLAFLLPFCGVPLVKFMPDVVNATATSAATTRTVRNLLLQSLSAVAHLERAHVVHRDIKGDNILVDPATHKLTLIDFGEAVECSTDDDNLQATVTRADGQVWGNTGTMPPEVSALSRDLMRIRGPSSVFSFAKCDSFSLSLTFYDAMLPPTNKFIGQFTQDMCTFSTELLPPLPLPHNINSGNTLTEMSTMAQVLVGMMSRDRATRLSASDALNRLHSI